MRLIVAVLLGVAVLVFLLVQKPELSFEADSDAIKVWLERERDLGEASCRPIGPDHWNCLIESEAGGGFSDALDVEIDEDRCWVARPLSRTPPSTDVGLHGCLGLLDYLGVSR
ncbi:MAG: hypothetical protein AABM29_07220 [Actinomycetota bacterium]